MLGKLIILILSGVWLFGANANIDKSQITQGEAITLTLSASGRDIQFPNIDSIDGFSIKSTGQSSQTINENGKITRISSRSYIFYPDKNITIPPFTIVVDSKQEHTKSLHVQVVDEVSLHGRKQLDVALDIDNKTPYVGELIKATITFRQDERVQVGSVDMEAVNFDAFWVKDNPLRKQKKENGYFTQTITYWLSPLKEGNQTLGPVVIKAGIRDGNSKDPFGMFFDRLTPKYIRSQALNLDVKPLPNGVKLVGNFRISSESDTSEIEAGKPVNIMVEIRGEGNFDDIGSLAISAGDAIVYDDKPKIETTLSDEGHFGVFRQKFAVISSEDVVVEPFELRFLDKRSGEVKTIKTKPITIKVKGKAKKSTQQKSQIITHKEPEVVVKKVGISYLWLGLAFGIGLFVGFLLSRIKFLHVKPKKPKIFTNQKEFLRQILPFKGKDSFLDEQITLLEKNIYENGNEKVAKREILRVVEKLKQ